MDPVRRSHAAMSGKEVEAVDVLEALEAKFAYLPGGRDREGRAILVVNVPAETQYCSTTKVKLERLMEYLLSIFNEETKKQGLCLIVDARRGSWRVARSYIRRSIVLAGSSATRVIVIRPDGFWEKRVDTCTKSRKDGGPIYIPITRLGTYVEPAQLPYDLGGSKFYDHAGWIQTRVRVEEYTKSSDGLLAKMLYLRGKLCSFDAVRSRDRDEVDLESYWEAGTELAETAHRIILAGRNLIGAMSGESSQDYMDSVQRIHSILDSIELEQVELENGWIKMSQSLDTAREIIDLEKGLSQVTDWILGPADSMLNSRCQVGFDVASSENLRREHEELELECRETYGRYAELLHRLDSVSEDRLTDDIKSQRDFMDFVCRSFATRLERRRNVLITSQRFFRLVSEYFDRTSEVFDKLVMGNRTCDLSQAGTKLRNLEKSQATLDGLLQELIKEGEKLSDILSMPVKDALGRDVHVDYGEDIVNIRDILDATNARKNIFNDSVELQKLTLKQVALIYAYENDAEQAVTWLSDLFGVLVDKHVEIGCDAAEIQTQKDEHQSFQDTAKGTFDYGCQLVNGARVLRISCRLDLENNTSLSSRLRQAWRRLRSVGQEQLTRLRVCAVFHRSVDEHCTALNELIDTVKKSLLKPKNSSSDENCLDETYASNTETLRAVLENREKLLPDVGRTVRLGKLLRSRIKEPLYLQMRMTSPEDESLSSDHVGNLTAIEAISERLAEVTRLAEKLDERLYEAGARTRNSTKELPGEANQRIEENVKSEEKNDERIEMIDCEGSGNEDYMFTEYTMTRSRSESFLTASGCDDGLAVEFSNSRLEFNAKLRDTNEPVNSDSTVPNIEETDSNETVVSRNLEINESEEDCLILPDMEQTSTASSIEEVKEESVEIVEVVTETRNLRIHNDNVASPKLNSNNLCENNNHAKIEGIPSANGSDETINGYGSGEDNPSCKDEYCKLDKESILYPDIESFSCKLENNNNPKFTQIVQRSNHQDTTFQIITETNNLAERVSIGVNVQRNDDSGIEVTPRKNGELSQETEELEDLGLLRKMTTLSRTQIVVENSTITSLRTIH